MKINDLLYNCPMDLEPRQIIQWDWCNWVVVDLPVDVRSCEDVRGCIDNTHILDVLIVDSSISIIWWKLLVNSTWINSVVDVVWTAPTLTIGDTSISLVDFLDEFTISFRDERFNSFSSAGIADISIDALDWLRFITDWVDALQIGLPIPDAEYYSDHNNTTFPQLPGDFLPFNYNLVLTRDDVQHKAIWKQKQCCDASLDFIDGKLTIDLWDTFVDIRSINTDNQELTLTGNELVLTRRHGGTWWVQIADPDSIVNLENVNEHTLGLMWNRMLTILWSDWLVNSLVDLYNVWPKTLAFNDTTNEVSILDDTWAQQSSVDISGVNNQLLSWINWGLSLSWHDWCCTPQMVWFRKPVQMCGDVMWCICTRRYTRAERVAAWLEDPSDRTMPARWYSRGWAQPTEYPTDFWDDFLDSEPTMCEMFNWIFKSMWWTPTPQPPVPPPPPEPDRTITFITNIYNTYQYNTWTNTYNTANYFSYIYSHYHEGDVNTTINLTSDIISRIKYRGKIFNTNTVVMRSPNTGPDLPEWARRYYPNMDGSDGRHTVWEDIIDSSNFLTPSNDLCVIAGNPYALSDPADYSTSMSANNPSASNDGMACQSWSKTMTIPFAWMYLITANLEIEADHNVHAFRATVMVLRDWQISPLVDTKFGWWSATWSNSLNDVTHPITKQYTCSGTKIVELKRNDVIFLWVRIDSRTTRPITNPQNWLQQAWLNSLWVNWFGDHVHSFYPGWDGHWDYYTPRPSSLNATLSTTFRYPRPTPAWSWDIYPSSFWSYGWSPAAYTTKNLLRPSPWAPDIWNRYYFSPHGGERGAENYWYVLWRGAVDDFVDGGGNNVTWLHSYDDDGVVKLLWPSGVTWPSWTASEGYLEDWGGMITVTYQNKNYAIGP